MERGSGKTRNRHNGFLRVLPVWAVRWIERRKHPKVIVWTSGLVPVPEGAKWARITASAYYDQPKGGNLLWTEISATTDGWKWDVNMKQQHTLDDLIHESDQRSNRWPYGEDVDSRKWSAFVGMRLTDSPYDEPATPDLWDDVEYDDWHSIDKDGFCKACDARSLADSPAEPPSSEAQDVKNTSGVAKET